MAVRKAVDDKAARDQVLGLLMGSVEGDAADEIVGRFPAIQFETATSRVAGEELRMRRVVLTGPWEVVRD